MEAREERQLMRMKGQLAKLDLLILDELGYVPASKRPGQQARQRTALRCDLSSLRTDQRHRYDEPAVRALDRGAGQSEIDWRGPGSTNAPLPHSGGDRR